MRTLIKLLCSSLFKLKPAILKYSREVRLRHAIGRIFDTICVVSFMIELRDAWFDSGSIITIKPTSLWQQLTILLMIYELKIMPCSILIVMVCRPMAGSTRLSKLSKNCSNNSELHLRSMIRKTVRLFGLIPLSVQFITLCICSLAPAWVTFEITLFIKISPCSSGFSSNSLILCVYFFF